MYDGSNNTTLYAIKDIYNGADQDDTVLTYELGKFPDGVWPVAGLYQWDETSQTSVTEGVLAKTTNVEVEQGTLAENVPALDRPVQGK